MTEKSVIKEKMDKHYLMKSHNFYLEISTINKVRS